MSFESLPGWWIYSTDNFLSPISSYHMFSPYPKVSSMLHHGPTSSPAPLFHLLWERGWPRVSGRVHGKGCYIIFTYIFLAFFAVFHEKICVFIIFISFFGKVYIEFPQQNINQSETWIGDQKLSLELYEYAI